MPRRVSPHVHTSLLSMSKLTSIIHPDSTADKLSQCRDKQYTTAHEDALLEGVDQVCGAAFLDCGAAVCECVA